MTLQQLRYFLAAVDHGSFTAAARSLYVAQPSLSEQVRQLEAELGVDLFARVGRGIAILRRDGARTESPNAGWPMATMAGLLGVRLTKAGHYALGDAVHTLDAALDPLNPSI